MGIRDGQGPADGSVMTVTGPIDSGAMGITLPHEHLLLYHTPDSVVLSDPDLAADELSRFTSAGGRTVVEVTSRGLRRDPAGLKRIAERAGANIIMGSSYYKFRWHPPELAGRTVAEIAEEIVGDFVDGADGTGVQAGVIGEVGISEFLEKTEEKVLRASALAQIRTGTALNLHVHLNNKGEEEALRMKVLDSLEEEGVDLNRVIMSHCEPGPESAAYHERIALRGVYVECDLFGMAALGGGPVPDYRDEAAGIRALIERGYLDRVLVSQDICFGRLLVANGGWGYAHILQDVLPAFRANGITEDQIRAMLVDNPCRVFPVSRGGSCA